MKHRWVLANWKMHGTLSSVRALIDEVRTTPIPPGVQVVCMPSFVHLSDVAQRLANTTVRWGAQDVCVQAEQGARTGDVCASMLSDVGASCVLVGHSERRRWHGETSETVAQKAIHVWAHGMLPVVCVGETASQYAAGHTQAALHAQLQPVLDAMHAHRVAMDRLVVAYEPVWAIGANTPADRAHIEQANQIIQAHAANVLDSPWQGAVVYGGSVDPPIARDCARVLDGVLVGRASQHPRLFADIVWQCGLQ